jgi:hypothetical protein
MVKHCRRDEQLELYRRPRRIPDWETLPVGVREEAFVALTRMFRDQFEPLRADEGQKQGGSRDE